MLVRTRFSELSARGASRRKASTISVIAVGRKPGGWLNDGAAEYEKRLNGSGAVKAQTVFVKSDADLVARVEKVKGKVFALRYVSLDLPNSGLAAATNS